MPLVDRILTVLQSPPPAFPLVVGGCASGRTTLLRHLVGRLDASTTPVYLDLERIATTPEQCYRSLLRYARPDDTAGTLPAPASLTSPRDAFLALLRVLTSSTSASGRPFTFLLDEVLEFRTFESFPGLKQVMRELGEGLASSRNRVVLASRFPLRASRVLATWPGVVTIPMGRLEPAGASWAPGALSGLDAYEVRQVLALADGRLGYAVLMAHALRAARRTGLADAVGALTEQMLPGAPLEQRLRLSYEVRLQRARGYGALRAILDALAEQQPMNLTQIAQRMHRTPGSTKDYLSWLLDVDLLQVERKRYTIADPLLRLWIRLNNGAEPPSDQFVAREAQRYATDRLASLASPDEAGEVPVAAVRPSSGGIIEID
jgi:hypothetical protein